jgi:hypothetical protein
MKTRITPSCSAILGEKIKKETRNLDISRPETGGNINISSAKTRKFSSSLIKEIQGRKHVANSRGMYLLKTYLTKLEPQTSRKKEIAEGEPKLEESCNYRF